jgi:hypothetical protein
MSGSRASARQGGALDHAAGERCRVLVGRRQRQPGQGQLDRRQMLGIGAAEPGVLDQRQGDVLGDGKRGKQRALLEQHAEAPFHQ